MTKVSFYILPDGARSNRYTLACRLADKAYQQGHRVFLHTESDAEARHMERLLWTFREGSFIPHGLIRQTDATQTPVLIGNGEDAGDEHDVLINLHAEVPQFFSRFKRVAEPIDQNAQNRTAGRTRYRFYKDRGYPLETHKINE